MQGDESKKRLEDIVDSDACMSQTKSLCSKSGWGFVFDRDSRVSGIVMYIKYVNGSTPSEWRNE
jgi:hypothetical protein